MSDESLLQNTSMRQIISLDAAADLQNAVHALLEGLSILVDSAIFTDVDVSSAW
jgi:hypothetical protein